MTKSALGIILVLGVFFLLAAGWGVYNFIELNRTQAELSVTESELLLTRTQRDDYAARLQSTQNSLTETEDELEETELELKANQAELKDTQQELTDIKFDLSAAELNNLILQNRYDQSQTELTAAVTTLDGLGINCCCQLSMR
jgi:septal ring factor EnvC (AmiA/AmiB activator)